MDIMICKLSFIQFNIYKMYATDDYWIMDYYPTNNNKPEYLNIQQEDWIL